MGMTRTVRDATEADAAACAAIYAPYVRDTAVSFETEPPDAAEFGRRIAAASARHAWLLLEDDGGSPDTPTVARSRSGRPTGTPAR